MKFAPRTFKIQWDLHAWAGVIPSLLLFVSFYCGIFALFHPAFSQWQQPESASASLAPGPSQVSYDRVLARVEQSLPIPRGASVMLRLPLGPKVEPGTSTVSVYHGPSHLQRDFPFDRSTGELGTDNTAHSRLADELYQLHFFNQVPWGVELSGLAALALFVALVSGVVIHWKDLVRQLWQFRPRLRLRFSASDAHKLLGVLSLPFALVFAWSGTLLGLWALLAAPLQYGAFGGSLEALDDARGYASAVPVETHRSASHLPLDELVERGVAAANAHFASPTPLQVERLDIELYGDESARFQLGFTGRGFEKQRSVELDNHGRVLRVLGGASTPTEVVDRLLFDLHYARYAGYLAKALNALLALAVCAVIVSGNLIWLERRDPARSRAGNRVLERLTVGVCLGLICSTAIYCAANRWLPSGLARRADTESWLWLAAWAASASAVFFGGSARIWAALLCRAAAVAFGAALVGDLLTRRAQVFAAWSGRAHGTLAAELVLLVLALSCVGLERGLRAPRQPRRPQPAAAASLDAAAAA